VRDGKTYAALSIAEFSLYPEAEEALRRARAAGFLNIVVTNQPDVASGKVARSEIEAMHAILRRSLEVDDVEVSYDPSGSDAPRRKPNPGMLFDAAAKWQISLAISFMIGDRSVDMQAARRAGCTAVFIDRQYAVDPPPESFDRSATNVLDAVLWCIAQASA
jgi:D-glycero-D-manno-heptose 1,7-bisphosphate phosphatase